MAKNETLLYSYYYDYYKNLLTDRQSKVVDCYYNKDMSLSEIAKILDVSRQAIYNNLLAAQKLLLNFEKHLELYKKTTELIMLAKSINVNSLKETDKNNLNKIISILEE